MLPDDTIADALKNLNDVGIVGSGLVLTIGALIFMVYWVRSLVSKLEEKSDAHLEDLRRFASKLESVESTMADANSNMRATTEALRVMIELGRHRS